jgi:hypothetical protein
MLKRKERALFVRRLRRLRACSAVTVPSRLSRRHARSANPLR